ncbi:MAG TPA: hypothetical protein VN132_10605 [Bdellovibrio sp.]|nr:hypothetical protein [Bdellovibrio sp.]
MKTLILISSLFLGLAAQASFVSVQQQNKLLQVLDEACGDSWCEGNYDINFKAISCTDSACSVKMNLELGIDEETFKQSPSPKFFSAILYLTKTPAFVSLLSSDSFKHNQLTSEFFAEVDAAMTDVLTGKAKEIKAPQNLIKPVSLSNEKSLTLLLQNIASSLEGGANVSLDFHSYKEVCEVQKSILHCNYTYINDMWNGEIEVTFKIENNYIIQIQSIATGGSL